MRSMGGPGSGMVGHTTARDEPVRQVRSPREEAQRHQNNALSKAADIASAKTQKLWRGTDRNHEAAYKLHKQAEYAHRENNDHAQAEYHRQKAQDHLDRQSIKPGSTRAIALVPHN
jgi:hypothetical protein